MEDGQNLNLYMSSGGLQCLLTSSIDLFETKFQTKQSRLLLNVSAAAIFYPAGNKFLKVHGATAVLVLSFPTGSIL